MSPAGGEEGLASSEWFCLRNRDTGTLWVMEKRV